MYFFSGSIIASLLLATTTFVNANTDDTYPLTTINNQTDFCIFLPPQPGLEVAINEDNGIPFCVNQNAVPNATVFPTGFLTTAHYLKTSSYVQITGFFDRTKYGLNETDGGGQYDNHANGKPVGATCKGYNYFVNLIEPDIGRFCIRCCQETADCNTGRSGYGCLRVVTGDYTNDNNMLGNTTTTSSGHSNNHINSVLAELDELPASNSSSATSTADSNSAVDELDDLSTSDSSDSSNDSTDSTDITDSTDSTDYATDYATDSDDTTDSTDSTDSNSNDTSNASQKIQTEIQTLKSDLANQQSVEEVQTQWKTFASQLSQDYPSVSTQIDQLTNISSVLTSSDQLSTFYDLVLTKLQNLNSNSTTTSDDDSTHDNLANW